MQKRGAEKRAGPEGRRNRRASFRGAKFPRENSFFVGLKNGSPFDCSFSGAPTGLKICFLASPRIASLPGGLGLHPPPQRRRPVAGDPGLGYYPSLPTGGFAATRRWRVGKLAVTIAHEVSSFAGRRRWWTTDTRRWRSFCAAHSSRNAGMSGAQLSVPQPLCGSSGLTPASKASSRHFQ